MSDYDTVASNVGAGDSENDTTGQRNLNNAGNNPTSMKALMDLKNAQKQAGDTPSPFKKGGKVNFSKIIRNKNTGVLSMKKAGGGSVRGSGCAAKGQGKGTMY